MLVNKAAAENLLIQTIYDNKNYFYRIAKRIVLNEQDVEDALQETVLRAFKSLSKLQKEEYIKTWLTSILINQCKNILKKKKLITFNEDFPQGIEEFNHDKLELRELVNKLNYDLKVIAVLYYYEDLPQKHIGEILDLPVGTVKSRLSKVRSELKIMMDIKE